MIRPHKPLTRVRLVRPAPEPTLPCLLPCRYCTQHFPLLSARPSCRPRYTMRCTFLACSRRGFTHTSTRSYGACHAHRSPSPPFCSPPASCPTPTARGGYMTYTLASYLPCIFQSRTITFYLLSARYLRALSFARRIHIYLLDWCLCG